MAKGGRESLRPSYGSPKLTLISREKKSPWEVFQKASRPQFNLIYVTLSQTLHASKAGRIKSVCDGVGGNIKTEVQAVALAVHRTSEKITIHPADDVKKVITNKNNLTYDVPVKDTRNCPEKAMKISHFNTNQSAPSIYIVIELCYFSPDQ